VVQEQASLDGILKKFAHPISLLPNLHTVQIHFKFKGYYDTASDSLVRNYLKGYTYPQIRNLSISSAADPFVLACPKLKVLKPYMTKYLSVRPHTLDHVPELEVLGHIRMDGETLKGICAFSNCTFTFIAHQSELPAIVKKLPKLRDLTISGTIFGYRWVGHSIYSHPLASHN